MKHSILLTLSGILLSFSAMANDTIRIYSNGCDDYQTFIGPHGGQLTMTANSDQWSHFVRWNDGNTDNPRTITTNGNADYTAYFETYKYSVQVQSNDAARGRAYIYKVVKGDTIEYNDSVGTFEAGSEVYLTCQANYGYHFVQWNIEQYHVVTGPLHIVKFSVPETWSNPYAWVWETGFYGYWTTLSKEDDLYVYKTTLSDMNIIVVPNGPDWANGQTNDLAITESCCYTISGENIYRYDATQHYDCFSTEEQAKIDQVDTMIYIDTTITNTTNPLSLLVAQNQKAIAYFAKNVYSITKNAEHGNISGNSSAEYLDEVTLTAVPDYGYHFTQWSDGNTDNPRVFQITKDTTFTAKFAYDRVGTCGKDLALVWSYDPANKVLTIGNAGEFTENMQFGVEAPTEMEELVIGNSVTAIGAYAFAGIETLKKVSIGESVKTIGEQAFFNCVNLETIFNYRPTPTNAYSTAFDGVDKFECKLYVLPSSIDMYKAAAVWRDFYYTYAIGAEEAIVVTNDVQVEPQDNAATLTWPTSNNAASYTIEITKDGVLFCTLTFNSNGQLTGIAFAPSRDGQAHAPAAVMTANGLQFTVTGLNSGTQYGYNLTAKDANDQTVATYSGSFTTTSEGEATGVENVPSDDVPCTKVIRNGQIYILRGDKTYTLQGQEVK